MNRFDYICGGEKYEVGGPKRDSIGLSVKPEGLPPTIEIEGLTLVIKPDFHVTLVAAGEIARKHRVADPEFTQKVVADFCKFVKENPIELLRFRDECRFATLDEKRSVVVMVNVSNLDKFFAQLNAKWGLTLGYPPTHATLYTLQPNIGIFLTDDNDMKERTKPIPSPVKL